MSVEFFSCDRCGGEESDMLFLTQCTGCGMFLCSCCADRHTAVACQQEQARTARAYEAMVARMRARSRS